MWTDKEVWLAVNHTGAIQQLRTTCHWLSHACICNNGKGRMTGIINPSGPGANGKPPKKAQRTQRNGRHISVVQYLLPVLGTMIVAAAHTRPGSIYPPPPPPPATREKERKQTANRHTECHEPASWYDTNPKLKKCLAISLSMPACIVILWYSRETNKKTSSSLFLFLLYIFFLKERERRKRIRTEKQNRQTVTENLNCLYWVYRAVPWAEQCQPPG